MSFIIQCRKCWICWTFNACWAALCCSPVTCLVAGGLWRVPISTLLCGVGVLWRVPLRTLLCGVGGLWRVPFSTLLCGVCVLWRVPLSTLLCGVGGLWRVPLSTLLCIIVCRYRHDCIITQLTIMLIASCCAPACNQQPSLSVINTQWIQCSEIISLTAHI